MSDSINFREVVDFTRYYILGGKSIPTPTKFNTLSKEEQFEVYERIWGAYQDACTYMSSALDICDMESNRGVAASIMAV